MSWAQGDPLGAGETVALAPTGAQRQLVSLARAAGLLDVDLSDGWAPFIFSEEEPGGAEQEKKPNRYRHVFIALANNHATPDELYAESPEGRAAILDAAGLPHPTKKRDTAETPEGRKALEAARRVLQSERSHNYLEVYGIPPTLSVLLARLREDGSRTCYENVDTAGLATFTDTVTYQNRDLARRDLAQAQSDAAWMDKVSAGALDAGEPVAALVAADPKAVARLDGYRRSQARLRAIRAVQARLMCEGLLSPKSKFIDGMFDLATHEALAAWERKNNIFGWGFLEGETLAALQRPYRELHFETLKRILAERVADAAGILEDGSVSKGKKPATYQDEAGAVHAVPNLIGEHVQALLRTIHVETAEDMAVLLRTLGPERLAKLHVAFAAPKLPPYYAATMNLFAEIDRGDVWYDFPWNDAGKPIDQMRTRYPSLTLFVLWNKQRVPLARWRTTIGSWRSEMHPDGRVYYKYKNSDVGPRIWKNIVASPVWIPPDGTPAKELLTKKVFDRNVGPVDVVNRDIIGPGFQSAYGLVMAIHLKELRGGALFDNQIRTHGSVDYTSIARRFSHGCHRLVNNRAVRLFGFILRHRTFARLGDSVLGHFKKKFVVDGKDHEYELKTRGYYYELTPPVPVNVTEGRIMGRVRKPITAYMRKPGVDYSDGDNTLATPVPDSESAPLLDPRTFPPR